MRSLRTRVRTLRALAIPALLALAAPALQAAPVAHAAGTTRLVSTTGADTGNCSVSPCATVNYAVSQSSSGDTIKVAPGSYSDEITIPPGETLTIVGGVPQFSAATVIALKTLSPGTTGSVLTVGKGATVSVQGISFTGGTGTTDLAGNVRGGDIYNNGNLSLIDTTVEGGTAAATTGAALGGGIYSAGTFASPASLLVQFSYVGPNQEVPPGPGITGNTVSATSGSATGGGIFNGNFSTLTVTCSLVLGNTARATGTGTALGGAIANSAGKGGVDGAIVPNQVGNGGGALVINTEIAGNSATSSGSEGSGGAIQNTGTMTLDDDTVDSNTASDTNAGGVAKGGGANTGIFPEVFNVNNTTFSGNTVTASGAFADGGAIAANRGGILNLTNATIADNSVTPAPGPNITGGGIWLSSAQGIFTNSLLARNTVGGVAADCNQTVEFGGGSDNGGNIDDDGTCGFGIAAGGSAYSISDSTNIQLGTLANNGGDVPTQAIPLTSDAMGLAIATVCKGLTGPTPAPNGTPNADTDARGLPRHAVTRAAAGNGVQGCDSGAYDTGDNITLPVTVIGAVPIPGLPGRLGFAASTSAAFPAGYITFQIGGSTFTVRQPILVSCPNQCLGTPNVPVPGTATVTLTGVISTAHGAYPVGAVVTLTVTILTTLGGPPSFTVTHTVTSIKVAVNGTAIATLLPPYQFGTYFIFQPLNAPSAP